MTGTIQVFEHERLTLHDTHRSHRLTKAQLDRLYSFNDLHGNKYFTGIRDGVKFNEHVGVIQVGGMTIEILPKADRRSNASYTIWRNVLLKMLGICKKINLEALSEADLSKRHHSLLDLYFDRFLKEMEGLLHRGLIKQYRFKEGNVLALKGQLQFHKHIEYNVLHQERFYTRHQIYDQEHLINQILLKALNILGNIVSLSHLKNKIKQLQLYFPEIREITITLKQLDGIKLNRKSQNYKEALQIARMIILNYAPDIKGGNENMIALLFNMNSLWEEYIHRMLLKVDQQQFDISQQDVADFWERKTIRPDIVLRCKKGSGLVYVIDTKWKVIDNQEPSDADLKQMYSYNQYWGATNSILLYPDVGNTDSAFGKFHKGILMQNYCKLAFVKVIENGMLDMNIGQKIFQKFEDE